MYLHQAEQDWLTNTELNRSALPGRIKTTAKSADYLIEIEEEIHIDSFSFKVLFTPGHSPGSISYYIKDESIIAFEDNGILKIYGRRGKFQDVMYDLTYELKGRNKLLLWKRG